MRVLLATPLYSSHLDAGFFWLMALSRQGHAVHVWDYRAEPCPPLPRTLDCAVVLKGECVNPNTLPRPAFCYWPDAFARDLGIEKKLALYTKVFTPVRPTPPGMEWLPTGWDQVLHRPRPANLQPRFQGLFYGTCTLRKQAWLALIRPQAGFGNGWGENGARPAVYGAALVSALHSAAVLVNVHRDDGVGLNRRFFEMIACNFTLTDRAPGVAEVLGPDLAPRVSFQTPEEGRDMLGFYLKHRELRDKLWAKEREAISGHTYDDAVKAMLAHV